MHRNKLEKNQGMLFVYPDQAVQGVWMKNTLLALDVIFISSDNKVVSILQNLQPCLHDPCTVFNSNVPAKYMLEIQAGGASENHIKIDQEVMIEYHHDSNS